MKLSEVEIPKVDPDLPLPPLRGTPKQVKWAQALRPRMLAPRIAASAPALFAAMKSITDSTWWIANHNRNFENWTWPKEWAPSTPPEEWAAQSDPSPMQQQKQRVGPFRKPLDERYHGCWNGRLTPAAGNPREVAFAEQWLEENDPTNRRFMLNNILAPVDHNGQPQRGYMASARDREVAATMIQWLGTNVGMSFLQMVATRSPQIRSMFANFAGQQAALPPICPHCGNDFDE